MRAGDIRLVADFMEAVERARPEWSVSLVDTTDDLFRLDIKGPIGVILPSPMPVSVERARGDISAAVAMFVTAASKRLYTATGRS